MDEYSDDVFRRLFDNSLIGLYRTTPSGRILAANPALIRMLGFSSFAELSERNLESTGFVDGYPRALFKDRIESQGAISGLESAWKRRDGSTLNVRESAVAVRDRDDKVLYYEGAVEDITSWKETQQELRASEERFAAYMAHLPGLAFVKDLDGRFLFVNHRFCLRFGLTPEQCLGHRSRELNFLPESVLAAAEQADAEVVRTGKHLEVVDELPVPSGGQHWLTIRFPLKDENAKVSAVAAISVDITEHEKVENERLRVQKLESLALVAGGIAHDFNNQLTTIVASLDLARALSSASPEVTTILDRAARSAYAARDLTYQLLTFARGGAPVTGVRRIESLVKWAVEFTTHGTSVAARVEHRDAPIHVAVDEGQMRRVFQNIIMNAIQAMPRGGVIEITTRRADDGSAEVVIADHGAGIPADVLPQIFDPYFTTKSGSSGLGLAAAHSIVRQHGGTITVDSRPGEGSRFTVRLPASEHDEAPRKEAHAESLPRFCRVLLMDDEESIRRVANDILEHAGFETIAVRNGDEAVAQFAAARTEQRPFDVVLLDLTVPGGMGGVETIRQLRAIDPAVRAIVMSGYSDNAVLARPGAHGFAAVLRKPFRIAHLLDAVHECLSSPSAPMD
ncbi:MAG: PAS domain S-box protein [Candidatus Schekmanbacteria bacterium]|nr:PAS domain S-box protein [Candidatus Schekmanbacteria bacterium]